MHIKALVTVDISPVIDDLERNAEIEKSIAELREQQKEGKKDFWLELCLDRLTGLSSEFSREVDSSVSEIMYPYCESMEDPEYLEFEDKTDELQKDYEASVDCIRLPEGRIVELESYPYYRKYRIRDGKVFQLNVGPLHHEKRTRRAKKMLALPNFPRAKVYKSFKEYAEEYRGFSYNEEHEGYGYLYNPNAMWDWYQIGGRWPRMFLVKTACKEYSNGERSWCNEDELLEAPEGYMWVAAARKRDICWEVMRDWLTKKAMGQYFQLKKMILKKKVDEGFRGYLAEDGIMRWGKYALRMNQTMDEYLEEFGIPKAWRYPLHFADIVDTDNWFSKDDCCFDEETKKYKPVDWRSRLEEYLDDLEDDTVLVGVDYHT